MSVEEVLATVQGHLDERRDAAATYHQLGQPDHARVHEQAAQVIARYLPEGA